MMSSKDLLRKASLIAEREKAIKSEAIMRGELFNVFRVCGVNHYENDHSAIMAEWLSPTGSHGQGDLYLRLFLNASDINAPADFQSRTAKVSTEVTTDYGRLDILLEDGKGNAIIIENKIYAGDQDSQLKRYEKFAQSEYGMGKFTLLYLSLFGDEASEQSGKGVTYFTISYQTTILGWLQCCAKESFDKPILRESIKQYESLIKQLTGQDMDENTKKELVAEMLRNPEGTAAIIKAYPEWEKTILNNSLFTPLQKYAEENDLEFGVTDTFWSKRAYGRFWFTVQPKLKIVFEYEKQGRYSFYYGITDERQEKRERKNLPGLQGGNDGWRYGWCYFDGIYLNWTADTIVRIANYNEEILSFIKGIIKRLLKEMRENNII